MQCNNTIYIYYFCCKSCPGFSSCDDYNQVQSNVDSMQGWCTVNFVTVSITKTRAIRHFPLVEYLCIFMLCVMVLLTTWKF
jgi:hypothetical protein